MTIKKTKMDLPTDISGINAVCLGVITHQPDCGILLEQNSLCYSVRICYTVWREVGVPHLGPFSL